MIGMQTESEFFDNHGWRISKSGNPYRLLHAEGPPSKVFLMIIRQLQHPLYSWRVTVQPASKYGTRDRRRSGRRLGKGEGSLSECIEACYMQVKSAGFMNPEGLPWPGDLVSEKENDATCECTTIVRNSALVGWSGALSDSLEAGSHQYNVADAMWTTLCDLSVQVDGKIIRPRLTRSKLIDVINVFHPELLLGQDCISVGTTHLRRAGMIEKHYWTWIVIDRTARLSGYSAQLAKRRLS